VCVCVCQGMSQSNCAFINPEKPQRHTYISQYQDTHTHKHNVKSSEVVTVVSLQIPAFLDVMLCHWATSSPLHFERTTIPQTRNHSPNTTVSHPSGLESSHMLNVRCAMRAVQRLHSLIALTLSPPSWS